jgi:hypothetical protein
MTSITPKIFSLYRNLSRSIARLPKKYQREEGAEELRETFSSTALPPSEGGIRELLENGEKRLAFLRMKTGGQSKGSYLVRYERDQETGEITKDVDATPRSVLPEKAGWSNWGAGNMDPDMVSRHQRGLKRARYKSHADAKGIF